jgi:tetratricopeptide (TPR) repeat protein
MPICLEKELPEKARTLWIKAKSAADLKNYGYAISLLQNVLKEAPGFLDGRKMLRAAAIAKSDGKKGSSSFFGSLSSVSLSGGGGVRKDPLAAMEGAERILESDPFNPAANHRLKEAALAGGFPEIAIFALETISKGNPKDTKVLHELGELYFSSDKPDLALEIFNRITESTPSDLVALKRAKDTAAMLTMKQGGWETAKSYRDLIKDKDEAKSLEQKGRTFKDIATIDAQLAELGQQYEANPQHLDVVRQIAQLMELRLEQSGTPEDLAGAVQWYGYCDQLLGGSDPAMTRKYSDLQLRQLDVSIKALQDWFAAGGDAHPEAATYQEQLMQLKQQRAAANIGEARKRVERNPTDLQLRFELAEKMMEAGQFTEAIPELQRARQNPNVRLRAISLLGQCYSEKSMNDLAVQQYKTAVSEMVAMDSAKKDALYRLALLHEKMGNRVDYLECLKEVYEADYGYLDVAQRVESSYGS